MYNPIKQVKSLNKSLQIVVSLSTRLPVTFKSVNIYQLDSKSAKYVTVNGSGESVFKPTKSLHNCKIHFVD